MHKNNITGWAFCDFKKNCFVEILFTYHKIHLLNVYNSMAFSIVTNLGKPTQFNFRTFNHSAEKPYTH